MKHKKDRNLMFSEMAHPIYDENFEEETFTIGVWFIGVIVISVMLYCAYDYFFHPIIIQKY